MKHLETFERFGFNVPFFNKKRIEDSELQDIPKKEEIQEIPVSWTGSYDYNGEQFMLAAGDYTNKGLVLEAVPDIHVYFVTTQGSYMPQELTVYKGDPEEIEARFSAEKYNL